MKTPRHSALTANVSIALNAVIAAVQDERPKVLCVSTGGDFALPYGPFDPERHRTFEIGVREWVELQTDLSLGFIEQLYTFGDKGREAPAAALQGGTKTDRIVSVGYLALAPEPAAVIAEGALWRSWYGFFPWEDWRGGEPELLRKEIIPELHEWSHQRQSEKSSRAQRIAIAFGLDGLPWEEERTLDRFELMYEAGLVAEAARDQAAPYKNFATGTSMISDHRRILATAIGRLRGKLKYRPIIFEMTPPTFTLLHLQRTIEAIVGFSFHKQNFRRMVEKSGFIVPTGEMAQQASGRPAALFQIDRKGLRDQAASGLSIPRLRQIADPAFDNQPD